MYIELPTNCWYLSITISTILWLIVSVVQLIAGKVNKNRIQCKYLHISFNHLLFNISDWYSVDVLIESQTEWDVIGSKKSGSATNGISSSYVIIYKQENNYLRILTVYLAVWHVLYNTVFTMIILFNSVQRVHCHKALNKSFETFTRSIRMHPYIVWIKFYATFLVDDTLD